MSRPLTNDELRECVEILCSVLHGPTHFKSCAEKAAAVREACDEVEASQDVQEYLENELGIGFIGIRVVDGKAVYEAG
jgi:hypothetical protein